MRDIPKILQKAITVLVLIFLTGQLIAQKTQINFFIAAGAYINDDTLSFDFGEQDLFITSEITDRISFLGETVFRFSPTSPTFFNVSVERVVIKYNYKGNHSILLGKRHTPINYWNDTYHHGRVFFPTIRRPLLFAAEIIPIHTTGLSLQGLNLGNLRFGYDLMVGNGLGSTDVRDNDKNKSFVAEVHIKPVDGLRIGISYYYDFISEGAEVHGNTIDANIVQHLASGSISYFGKKYEVLAEATYASNYTHDTGSLYTIASYLYAGIRLGEKFIPYIRIDNIQYQDGEVYFEKNNATTFITGLRYEINYLAVVKLEYQYDRREFSGNHNTVAFQIALGF